ncbi:MAG: Gfo/Idh/MocA family oxidoreductase [Candidatus Nanopelagicales bacterium]|nr:Gfo/Idh/MocA family oxidoreductase [Candidatus Nanopelagicales bacterium]MBL6834777.1 Gfo/Idh/MocA family oxidoreductase [Candidatus Nanopelagicales bacterium]
MGGSSMGVGMIGYSFMGAVHSHAWRTVGRVFDLGVDVDMRVICGRNDEAVTAAAAKYGWQSAETDWRAVIARDDIDIIDVCTPGSSHEEIAVAALNAGKHVICEKPLANTVAEAERMAAAAQASSGKSMVAFNYRRVPALAYARELVRQGRLGRIFHVRAVYLQDWIIDPEFPLVWRLVKEEAGSGALGDLGAHIVDAAQFVTGSQITNVSGELRTFIDERPLVGETHLLEATKSAERGKVTVDDAALFLANFDNGAVGTFEATRFASGRKNGMAIEVNGEKASLRFEFESMNELWVHDHTVDGKDAGFRRVMVTEGDHPYVEGWWPPGHVLGYDHTFTHEFRDFVLDIVNDRAPEPSFADGLYVQRVLDAVERSAQAQSMRTNV